LKPKEFPRMQQVLIVIHLIVTLLLVGTVLMQRSEGGALGIGGGGSGNLFSSRGAGNALTRATAILAACFFVTSIALAVLATRQQGGSVFDRVTPTTQQVPATPGSAPKGNEVPDALMPKLDGSAKPAAPATPVAPAQ
jgi:preprotein translocase subunit SecG